MKHPSYTIRDPKRYARQKGGECISETYTNHDALLEWLCAKADIFLASWKNVKVHGSWCDVCAVERRSNARRLGLGEAIKAAKSRGWRCLSTEYVNGHSPLMWKCAYKHSFPATLSNVKNKGSRCPECASSRGELACRAVLERAFHTDFPKKKPRWLKVGKSRLELDGYSKKLQVAFEFNGKQHYQKSGYFENRGGLDTRKHWDRLKRKLCRKNGVRLMTIAYTTPISKIPDALRRECGRLGLLESHPNARFMINKNDLLKRETEERFRRIVAKKKGKIGSEVIYSLGEPVPVECAAGHQWDALPYRILGGSWCGECEGNRRLTIEDMQRIAAERNLECLERTVKNMRTQMRWRCKKCGHVRRTTAGCIRSLKIGCPECAGKKRGASQRKTMTYCHDLAAANAHRCLSKSYKNNRTPMEWKCEKRGHKTFWRSCETVASGRWCSICRGTRTAEGQNSQSGLKAKSKAIA